jgi:hypothetical protein
LHPYNRFNRPCAADAKVQEFLQQIFDKDTFTTICPLFAREKIRWNTLHLLKPHHLDEMGLPVGVKVELEHHLQHIK